MAFLQQIHHIRYQEIVVFAVPDIRPVHLIVYAIVLRKQLIQALSVFKAVYLIQNPKRGAEQQE